MSIRRMRSARPGVMQHPLGPLLYRVAARRATRTRLIAAGVLVGCLALLAVAVWLRPDRRGLASHRQLGLPPCSMVALLGYPCPTCGMTTAFAHVVRGELLGAFRAQPAGLALALATIAAAAIALDALLTGRVWAINWYRVPPGRLAMVLIVVMLGGWVYKILAGIASGEFPAIP